MCGRLARRKVLLWGVLPACLTTFAPTEVSVGVEVGGRGLAALAAGLHFPFLQEEVFSFLVTLHLELCKQVLSP